MVCVCVSRKALESLASRGVVDDGREKMHREMESLREAFNTRIQELEEVKQTPQCFLQMVENMFFIFSYCPCFLFFFSLCKLPKRNWKAWPPLLNRRS